MVSNQKRIISRMFAIKQKALEKQKEKEIVDSLNMRKFFHEQMPKLVLEFGPGHAKFIFTIGIAKKISAQMGLPESKKRMFQRLFLEEGRMISATAEPIPKKEVAKIMERTIQIQKTALVEASRPAKDQIKQVNKILAGLEEIRKKMMEWPGDRVKITEKTAANISLFYGLIYRRLLGEKNYWLLENAIKESIAAMG